MEVLSGFLCQTFFFKLWQIKIFYVTVSNPKKSLQSFEQESIRIKQDLVIHFINNHFNDIRVF